MSADRSPRPYEVDLDRFWTDDAASHGRWFSADRPQTPLAIRMPATCVYDELGLPMPPEAGTEIQDPYFVDKTLRIAYNDKAERLVGMRFLPEGDPPAAEHRFPGVKGITDLFEATVIDVGGTGWVMPSVQTPAELEALLDRVEKRDLRAFLFPANWDAEVKRIREAGGAAPRLGGGVRGPVTAAMSIYGVENLIFLINDLPELAARFRDVLADVIIRMTRLFYEVSGTPDRRGFGFNDDNCAMLSPELYAAFGQPILRRVYAEFAPGPDDWRFQHSDSAMGHLLPLLNEVGVNHGNFGPTLRVEEIRAAMPRTVIHGQIAPWTFARGTDDEVAAEALRDIRGVGSGGGLLIATAGSINPGSRLSGLRAIMSVIQREGRPRG
jgi:uroporphyrinogen decarboxylase